MPTQASDLPIFCSMTIESDGSLFFGGNVFEAAAALAEMGADAVGINCSTGPGRLESVIKNLKQTVDIPIIAKPNAGMPTITATGEAVYSMEPDEFAGYMTNSGGGRSRDHRRLLRNHTGIYSEGSGGMSVKRSRQNVKEKNRRRTGVS